MSGKPARILLCTLVTTVLFSLNGLAQPTKTPPKKYPSILWEITGKGIDRPSYLFGTMHVSNKMVFNLGDSFYHAIRSAESVGLELDPGYWQEHFYKNGDGDMRSMLSMFSGMDPGNYNRRLTKYIFSIDPQEKRIEGTLAMEPTMINSLLYRKSEMNQDQEEDTYLDLYLYQIGNKLNKQIVGLEQIDTSERLMKEATLAMKDEKRTTSYDDNGYVSMSKIEDAYKKGDLDLLDSLDRIQMPSKRYRAIFLDHRNEIQAKSIDSVIKLRKTIFAGVGCAHLPGENGVIEILRRMGYKLRPVKMNVRNSAEKDRIDKMRFPVRFTTQYTPDSVVKADIPGKWYRFERRGNVLQYADLANGSYYMLGRVPTEALFRGATTLDMLHRVDSMLYENIPGKIISKTPIEKDGYKGFDIINRTRRGDAQHYQIFVTPFEVIIAKMSGSMDYVLDGTEATTFFSSVTIKKLEQTAPLRFTPAWGAFSVSLPHAPFVQTRIDGKAEEPISYEATDVQKGIHYLIMKETVQRSNYIEEDTFELNLLNESYMSSKVFEKELSRKFILQNGFPALEASYRLKNGDHVMARFVIQGPHYYAILAQQKRPFTSTPPVLSGFTIEPFRYKEPTLQTDTTFGYTFMSPVPMPAKPNASEMDILYRALEKENSEMKDMIKRMSVLELEHDSTGESINLAAMKFPPYTYIKDSTRLQELFDDMTDINKSSDILLHKSVSEKKRGWDVNEKWFRDTNSSRMLHFKTFYKQGVAIILRQYSDTLSRQSSFSTSVFDSFSPADTITGVDLLQPKGPLFFREYASKDSVVNRRALANLSSIQFTKDDVQTIERSLASLSWGQPNYLGIKKRFFASLGRIQDVSATELLVRAYAAANDTALYQEEILKSLMAQRTQASFKAFEKLVTNDPPVDVNTSLDEDADGIKDNKLTGMFSDKRADRFSGLFLNGNSANDWHHLSDTMQLTRTILPGLVSLLNLDDYKEKVQDLLLQMTDSGLVAAADVRPFYTKFLLEGKHLYKKALAQEGVDGMKKKAKEMNKDKEEGEDDDEDGEKENVFAGLYRRVSSMKDGDHFTNLYDHLVLLTPFYDSEPSVKELFRQTFGLQNKDLRYKLLKLMIRKQLAPYPDTLIRFFAADEKLRRRLYNFLNMEKQLDRFPAAYGRPLDMARSRMAAMGSSKPDTVAYVGNRSFNWRTKKGEMFFFKYKMNKDDKWKWATVGLLPEDGKTTWDFDDRFDDLMKRKVDETKILDDQMNVILKEALCGQRACAYGFYSDEDEDDDED